MTLTFLIFILAFLGFIVWSATVIYKLSISRDDAIAKRAHKIHEHDPDLAWKVFLLVGEARHAGLHTGYASRQLDKAEALLSRKQPEPEIRK